MLCMCRQIDVFLICLWFEPFWPPYLFLSEKTFVSHLPRVLFTESPLDGSHCLLTDRAHRIYIAKGLWLTLARVCQHGVCLVTCWYPHWYWSHDKARDCVLQLAFECHFTTVRHFFTNYHMVKTFWEVRVQVHSNVRLLTAKSRIPNLFFFSITNWSKYCRRYQNATYLFVLSK